MTWFILAALNLFCILLCWCTAFIVVLFANEEGELPRLLKGWQPWDDSCDSEQEVLEEAPKWLRYDFHAKYYVTEGEIPGTGRTRRYTNIYPWAKFSIKERLQRYCCRVMWLMRNPAYGFGFYLLGRTVDCSNVIWVTPRDGYRIGYDRADKSMDAAWSIKDDRRINKYIRKSWYLGWKIPVNGTGVVRCMIATRLSLRFKKESSNA